MTRARDLAAGTFEQATGGVLKLETSDTTVTDGSVLGKIEFKAPDEASGTDAILVGAAIEAVAEGTFAADNNATELVFKTGASAAATTKMVITSGGDVGIGTSSPTAALDVLAPSNQEPLILRVTTNSFGYATFRNAAGSDVGYFGLGGGAVVATGSVSDFAVRSQGNLIFASGGATERMRIDSSGAVTMPAQPAFLARPASQQDNFATNTGGGVTAVAFGSEVFDQNADFSSNTFTAPVTGKYQLNVLIYLLNADLDVGYYQPILATSNRSYSTVISTGSYDLDVAYTTISQSVLADMDAGDTASVGMQTPSGGAAQADVSTSSHFSGYLVA